MVEQMPIPDTPEIRQQLDRMLASNTFRRRRKLLNLLKYLFTETMAGRAAELTQKRIAIDVFSAQDTFDVAADGAVRIAAARLRSSLKEYYKNEAGPDDIRVHIPQRHYYIAVERKELSARPEITPALDYESRSARPAKKISHSDIIGELGINLIQRICLEIGFLWHPTRLEAGIDGYIEIRLEAGEVTNCIIQVQSKATDNPFQAETESTLEFRCDKRDLDYWLAGNAPVILVRSRPRTNEAYWVSLKDYFSDLGLRKSGKILFDKIRDRFDLTAKPALERLASHADSGLYLGAHPKTEVVFSNLLELKELPRRYYMAATEYRTRGELFATLHDFTRTVAGEWILGRKMLTSFHDLSTYPWTEVCDRGTVEEMDTYEWARSGDPVRQREFVQLLNSCLRDMLFRKGVKFFRETQCYYFRASQDLSEREYSYHSRERKTSRYVFKGYPKRSDHTQMSYYRHSALEGRFVRYGTNWYLQITPTYHFTRDGERISRYAPDLMAGIKRLESNQSVHGQVVMWAHLLTERSLFDTGSQFLHFGSLVEFELEVGVDDAAWLKHEDADKYALLQDTAVEREGSLFL
jgi:hypothetical protein